MLDSFAGVDSCCIMPYYGVVMLLHWYVMQ